MGAPRGLPWVSHGGSQGAPRGLPGVTVRINNSCHLFPPSRHNTTQSPDYFYAKRRYSAICAWQLNNELERRFPKMVVRGLTSPVAAGRRSRHNEPDIIWGLSVTISVWRMTAYEMPLTDESVSHGALWKGLEDLFLWPAYWGDFTQFCLVLSNYNWMMSRCHTVCVTPLPMWPVQRSKGLRPPDVPWFQGERWQSIY